MKTVAKSTSVQASTNSTMSLQNPLLRVVATWIWWLLGAALAVVSIAVITENGLNNLTAALSQQRHLIVYVEIVSVGLLPVLFTLICRDDVRRYGFQRRGLAKGLLLSLVFVAFMYGVGYLMNGQIMSDNRPMLVVAAPWNIFYGLLSIFAWGPLEVFFVVWLIDNTDAIFGSQGKIFSWGLVLTVVIFALTHIVTTGDLFNTVYTGFIFLLLALVFKSTRNIYGPMLAWTLINGQVWFMAQLLLN